MAIGEYNIIGRVEPGAPTAGKGVVGIENEDGDILEITVRKCIPGVVDTHTAVTATGTSGVLKAANNDRIALIVQNNGANNIYLSFDGGAAVASTDTVVEPGAAFEEIWSCNGCTVITDGTSVNVRVREIAKPAL